MVRRIWTPNANAKGANWIPKGTDLGAGTPTPSPTPSPTPTPTPSPTLQALTLSANTIVENSTVGTIVGALLNTTALSTLSLSNNAGGRFSVSAGNIVATSTPTNYEAATSHSITVVETLVGATNSPNSTTLTINVTNVNDTNPNAFVFTDVSSVSVSTLETSNTITLTGLGSDTVTVTLSGDASSQGQKNGGSWGAGPWTGANGDTFAVRHTSSASHLTAVSTTLTAGTTSDIFTSTTDAATGTVTSFPMGLNVTDHFRGNPLLTNLYYGDDLYYLTSGGLVSLPAANRGADGWPTSAPGDSVDGVYYTNINYPLSTGTADVTWTGLMDYFNISGPGISISGSGAAGPRVVTFTYSSSDPNAGNAQLAFKPNATTPGKNIQIIPSGRSSSDIWLPEFKTALSGFTASSGYVRTIKWHQAVERGSVATLNPPSAGSYWNDDIPRDNVNSLLSDVGRHHWYCFGHKETDAQIITTLGKFDAWLTANPSRKITIQSGNEDWNTGLYFQNHLYLSALAINDGLAPPYHAGATITSITHSGNIATVTTATAHGLATGDRPIIHGASPSDYNFYPTDPIAVINSTQFTYGMYSTPATNATSVGTLYVGGVASDILAGQVRESAKRSMHIMDLVAANISPGNLSRVRRSWGTWGARPTDSTDIVLPFTGFAGKHDYLGVGAYFGGRTDLTYPYPASGAYTSADFNAIRDDSKIGTDAVFDLAEYVRGQAVAAGMQGVDGYELGIDRNFTGNATIASITRSGTTATCTTATAHNLSTGDGIYLSGASPSQYNVGSPGGLAPVTVTGTTTFTYTMASDPGSSATVVGSYQTNKVAKLWYESQQCYDWCIYSFQEWHSRFGTPANFFYMQGPIYNENWAGRSLYTYLGQPAGIGVGKSAKAQAVMDYVAGSVRLPNTLVATSALVARLDNDNGHEIGRLRKYVVDSVITIQACTGGVNTGLFAVASSATSPNGIAVTVADKTKMPGSAITTTVTFRETHPSFPAPGYKDTNISVGITAALNNTHAYRYYRLNVTACTGGPYIRIFEIAATPGGADTAAGAVTASANDTAGAPWPPSAAFDLDPNSFWATNLGAPAWLLGDYGASSGAWIAANEFRVKSVSGEEPTAGSFQGSDDGSSWTTLKSFSGLTWSSGEIKTFTV